MKIQTLHDLLISELRDLYSAETQLVKALPRMVRAAASEELRTAFEEHLEQTRGHVERLEEIFASLDAKAKGKKCHAMEGLIEEAQEYIKSKPAEEVIDAGLIACAQKVEHYEIAGYGTVCSWAEQLGQNNVLGLLQQTLEEEKETDKRLTRLAESGLNQMATAEARS